MNIKGKVLFYSGNGNHQLGAQILKQVTEYLGSTAKFSHTDFGEFPDGESDAQIPKYSNINGKVVVFYQSVFSTELFEEALELIWAMKKQYGAKHVIAVFPFMIFRRQDHKENMSEICRLRMAIDRLKHAGVDELITISPHSSKMAEFCEEFEIKMHEVDPSTLFASTIDAYTSEVPVVYSPDRGSIPRAIALAKLTNSKVIFSLKERGLNNDTKILPKEQKQVEEIIKHYTEEGFTDIHYADASRIKGQTIVMVEDEVSTGGTANKTGQRLKQLKAKEIIFLAVHPVFVSGWRRKLFDDEPFDKVIMGNTIPRDYGKQTGGLIHTVDTSGLLGKGLFKSLKPFI